MSFNLRFALLKKKNHAISCVSILAYERHKTSINIQIQNISVVFNASIGTKAVQENVIF